MASELTWTTASPARCLLCDPPAEERERRSYDQELIRMGGWTWAAELGRKIGVGREVGRRLLSRLSVEPATHGKLRLFPRSGR